MVRFLAFGLHCRLTSCTDFTTGDIQCLTEKFWHFHQDMIHTLDSAAFSLLAIQYNLCVGTLAPFLEHRPDLKAIVEPLLSFDIS